EDEDGPGAIAFHFGDRFGQGLTVDQQLAVTPGGNAIGPHRRDPRSRAVGVPDAIARSEAKRRSALGSSDTHGALA
ncbi:hypothetical protein, partial [Escherichia coli]|uniref:hypothetical protein n=1 Tax=Escherichia coli TaxID=562 RepID=UPI003CE550B0